MVSSINFYEYMNYIFSQYYFFVRAEKCKIGSTPQNDWYFFSHKDKKYPTGTRTNRATAAGFWKATGRDKVIYNSFKRIGMRKTLVFYKGRAPHGQKSDWIMHEYRLDELTDTNSHSHSHVSLLENYSNISFHQNMLSCINLIEQAILRQVAFN